jgi:hypothetical protein
MKSLTNDEVSILTGIILSAGVAGIGILELYTALGCTTLQSYVGTMIVGAMLFNAGLSGVIGMLSVWFNYRAIL